MCLSQLSVARAMGWTVGICSYCGVPLSHARNFARHRATHPNNVDAQYEEVVRVRFWWVVHALVLGLLLFGVGCLLALHWTGLLWKVGVAGYELMQNVEVSWRDAVPAARAGVAGIGGLRELLGKSDFKCVDDLRCLEMPEDPTARATP